MAQYKNAINLNDPKVMGAVVFAAMILILGFIYLIPGIKENPIYNWVFVLAMVMVFSLALIYLLGKGSAASRSSSKTSKRKKR